MDQESIVYGVIKNVSYVDENLALQRRRVNRAALLDLATAEECPFLSRDIFSMPSVERTDTDYQTNIIHFGASYKAVEYEWEHWVSKFEGLLKQMYWSSAVVHLETELSGHHTFIWEAAKGYHEPSQDQLYVRCEWAHEGSIRSMHV